MKARTICLVLLYAAALPLSAAAQSWSAGLLTRARNALSDSRYTEADSLARFVLERAGSISGSQRILALQIAAAARYPADPNHQRAESAKTALLQLIQLGHLAPIPPDLSWPGLDSLFAAAGGTLPSTSMQGAATAQFTTSGGTKPTRVETMQWMRERLALLAGITWQDSGEVAIQAAAERVYGIDVQPCMLQYKVRRWSEDLVLEAGRPPQRTNVRRIDSSYSVDLRTLDWANVEMGATDVATRFMLPGALPMRVVHVRAYERGAQPDARSRRIDLGFMRNDQAAGVKAAIEHLIELCQLAPP